MILQFESIQRNRWHFEWNSLFEFKLQFLSICGLFCSAQTLATRTKSIFDAQWIDGNWNELAISSIENKMPQMKFNDFIESFSIISRNKNTFPLRKKCSSVSFRFSFRFVSIQFELTFISVFINNKVGFGNKNEACADRMHSNGSHSWYFISRWEARACCHCIAHSISTKLLEIDIYICLKQ